MTKTQKLILILGIFSTGCDMSILGGREGACVTIMRSKKRAVYVSTYVPLTTEIDFDSAQVQIKESWLESQWTFDYDDLSKSVPREGYQLCINVNPEGLNHPKMMYPLHWMLGKEYTKMQRYNSNSLRVLFDTLLPDTISLHIVVGEIPFIKDRHVVDSITFVKKHLKGFN